MVCKNQNRKIKVMRVVSRLNIGGPTIHMKILIEGLDKNRFKTELLFGSLSSHEGDMSYLLNTSNNSIKKIQSLQREIHPIRDLMAFISIFNLIRKEKPDIVHTHMAKAGAVGRVAAWFYNLIYNKNIKLVHTYHGNVLEGYFNPFLSSIFLQIERVLAIFTHAVIAISQTQKWELTRKYEISKPNRIHVISLGFDLKPFLKLDSQKGVLRKRIGIDDTCVLIGIVGRLVPIKNHFLFLNAAKAFIDKNPDVAVKFIVVGDGELREKLKSYASRIGIRDKVIFWGWERDIRIVYGGLDLLALTSINEGTPVSIIEAMASGVPVITTGVGAVRDLLGTFEEDEGNANGFKICERGVLCPTNDPDAFANGIKYLVNSRNIEGCERIERSKRFVLESYSKSILIDKIEKLYGKLVDNYIS